jgi:hypothetical protein
MRTRRLAIGIGVLAVMVGGLLAPSVGATSPGDGAAAAAARVQACRGVSSATGTGLDQRPLGANALRGCLKLNQVQALGSHNSYREPTTPQILEVLRSLDAAQAESLEYGHSPLPDQFESEGVRQIELDVFADPDGGLYSRRPALTTLGLPNPTPPELLEPGFKVLHIQDVDFNSSCLTLVDCLEQVKDWSDAHPRHLPIAILVELKEGSIPDPFNLGFVTPLAIGGPELDALDDEIRSVFPEDHLITPDDVRGGHATLEEAVLAGGWPTLHDSAGKVLFMMDNGGDKRDLYRAGRPSLEGRVLFTNATPGSPDAAFVKMNDPVGHVDEIQQLVRDGYVVRTRADEPTIQARSGDTTMRDAALASGAQWVSTDYPVPGRSIWSDYFASIPEGDPARCNPINTGPRCRNDRLEPFRRGRPLS